MSLFVRSEPVVLLLSVCTYPIHCGQRVLHVLFICGDWLFQYW